MSRHLTGRFWFAAAMGFGLLVFGLGNQSMPTVTMAVPFFVTIVLSLLDGWWVPIRVPRAELIQRTAIEGDHLVLEVELRPDRPVRWVELELQLPAMLEPLGPTRVIRDLRGGVLERFDLRAARWGITGPEWLTVTGRDRFGLTETVQQLALYSPLRVHPPTDRLKSMLPLPRSRAAVGEHRGPRRGSGTELAEVRDYRNGDPVRMIHAGLSLKRGKPVVVERHTENASDVVLYVDSVQDVGEGLDTTLRWTVTAALALANRHQRSMDRVGILDRGAGVRWLTPGLGRRSLHTVVDSLLSTSALTATTTELPSLPLEHLGQGTTIVAVSPLLSAVVHSDLALLRQRNLPVVVIRPEIPETSGSSLSLLTRRIFRLQNEVNIRRVRDLGIVVLPWEPHEPLEPVIRRATNLSARTRSTAGAPR